jgi:hypothetical protein
MSVQASCGQGNAFDLTPSSLPFGTTRSGTGSYPQETTMPQAPRSERLPKVPLTCFHNNTSKFLDLALTSPVTLTNHGRAHWKIAEAAYYDRLEVLAAGNVCPTSTASTCSVPI